MINALSRTIALLLAASIGSGSAMAATGRTFVSAANGVDSGTCAATAPCRSFTYALTQTNPAGEIVILAPGGYGSVVITQAVSIVNDGVGTTAISLSSGGTGITVQAGSTDVVQLRGLAIEGNTVGSNGILFTSGAELDVTNCVILNVAGPAVSVTSAGSSTYLYSTLMSHNSTGVTIGTNATLTMTDDKVTNNSGDGVQLTAATSSAKTYATFKRVTMSGNANGLDTGAYTTAFVNDSEVTNNSTDGVKTLSGAIYVDRSIITGNGVGLANTTGTIVSYENNDVAGNTTVSSGTITKSATY